MVREKIPLQIRIQEGHSSLKEDILVEARVRKKGFQLCMELLRRKPVFLTELYVLGILA